MYIGCKSNKQVNMQTHIEQRGSLNIDIFNISTNSTYLLFAICNYLFSQRCCCIQLRYCSTCKELFPFSILVNIPYHLNVHTRHVSLSATETPWHYSREDPATINLEQTFLFVVLKYPLGFSLVTSQARGPPPSPLQASLPSSPPAHRNPGWRLKSSPSLVCFNFRSQSKSRSTGTSTSWIRDLAINIQVIVFLLFTLRVFW